MRWLVVAILASACSAPQPTCEQAAGVWRAADGGSYQVTRNRDGYEMYAMFDTARPPTGDKDARGTRYAPVVFDLRVAGGAISGRRSQRITRGASVCDDRRTVRGLCADGRMTIEYGAATTCSELGELAPAATLVLTR